VASAVRTIVALDTGVGADAVNATLPQDAEIDVVGVIEGLDAAARALESTDCDVLVVACVGYSDRVLYLIENTVRQAPDMPVLVLADTPSSGFVQRVFEVGADDIVVLPQPPQVLGFAIKKAIARRGGVRARSTTVGRLIVVLGPKGGTGKTLTATNLAVALQNAGERVALVDLDLQFGDVGLCLGLRPARTIHDLAASNRVVDREQLHSVMVEHTSGVRALIAPSRPDHASVVTVELVREIYTLLRAEYDVVVVDTPPGFTPEVIATIDMATDLVMVGMLDSLSLKNTKLGLETLDLMGVEGDEVRLVLNRANTRVGISNADVEAILGAKPDVLVPSDRAIPRAVNEGRPIVTAGAESEAAAAFRKLAGFYLNGSVPIEYVAPARDGHRSFRAFGRKGA
jgi:pilus assembly protein CpaE